MHTEHNFNTICLIVFGKMGWPFVGRLKEWKLLLQVLHGWMQVVEDEMKVVKGSMQVKAHSIQVLHEEIKFFETSEDKMTDAGSSRKTGTNSGMKLL